DVLHREWYDHVLNYKFKEDFVYYNKGQIQFYEVKNIPFKYRRFSNTFNDPSHFPIIEYQIVKNDSATTVEFLEVEQPDAYFSATSDYDRKAYFEYNDKGDITFEMNEDAYFQIRKFYYDYDYQGRLALIKHFKDGVWKWTENVEYPDEVATQTFVFPEGKRFPYLVEQRVDYIKKRFAEIERIEIPEDDIVTKKQKRVITYDGKDRIKSNDYWKEIDIAPGRFEYRNMASDQFTYDTSEVKREIYIKGKKTLTETFTTNKLNQPTTYTAFSYVYDTLLEKYRFVYNDLHALTAVEVYNYDVSSRKTTEVTVSFDYSYDAMGNWVKQVKYVNGKPIFIWDRSLEYY
ncbi:MAG: hypothetical protein NWQ09_11630, partial [Nonlabens sp.]|nr:hypothetical protein [Nonlabens sp.]